MAALDEVVASDANGRCAMKILSWLRGFVCFFCGHAWTIPRDESEARFAAARAAAASGDMASWFRTLFAPLVFECMACRKREVGLDPERPPPKEHPWIRS